MTSSIDPYDFEAISKYLKNKLYGIDPLYVIDVCLDNDTRKWYILELNCFNTSGIYGSDLNPDATVRPVFEAAIEYAAETHNLIY